MTSNQTAPSGRQPGSQINQRETIASAARQYAAVNAIAPSTKSIRDRSRSLPTTAAARRRITQSKIQLTRRTYALDWIVAIVAAKTSGGESGFAGVRGRTI